MYKYIHTHRQTNRQRDRQGDLSIYLSMYLSIYRASSIYECVCVLSASTMYAVLIYIAILIETVFFYVGYEKDICCGTICGVFLNVDVYTCTRVYVHLYISVGLIGLETYLVY